MFKQLPQQRKLPPEVMKETQKLLGLHANRKMVQDKLVEMTGKAVLLKDLANINTRMKLANTKNNLDATVKELIEKHGKFTKDFGVMIYLNCTDTGP